MPPVVHSSLQKLTPEMFAAGGVPVAWNPPPPPAPVIIPPVILSPKEWRELINGAWHKGARSVIETGQKLVAAKEALAPDVFERLLQDLAFEASIARKLMLIARSVPVCAILHKLPPHWTTIYALTKLKEGDLRWLSANGRIHPGMKAGDIRDGLGFARRECDGISRSPAPEKDDDAVPSPNEDDAPTEREIARVIGVMTAEDFCRYASPHLKAEIERLVLANARVKRKRA